MKRPRNVPRTTGPWHTTTVSSQAIRLMSMFRHSGKHPEEERRNGTQRRTKPKKPDRLPGNLPNK